MTEKISWLGNPEARILSIRKFRKYIDTLPFDQAVRYTFENWNMGPRINSYHFDIANVEEWPTPWNLFAQTTFCRNSQILGSFYTLILSSHNKDHVIKLIIFEDDPWQEYNTDIVFDNNEIDEKIIRIITATDIKEKLGV